MLHPGKSHRLLWSGMVLVQYTRGKTLILTGSSPNILGNNTFVVLPWVEIFAFPGFLAIPVNMFARMFAHLAFRLLRLLSDHCGFLGWVKFSLKCCCSIFDWNTTFAFFCICSAVSWVLVLERMILWVFSTGYSLKITKFVRSSLYKAGWCMPQ